MFGDFGTKMDALFEGIKTSRAYEGMNEITYRDVASAFTAV